MNFKRILIFRIGHLGDTVVALPALWTIRKAFPKAEITLLTNQDIRNPHYISPRTVLPETGLIDKWMTFPTNVARVSLPLSWLRLFAELRRDTFDALIYLMPRNRTSGQIDRDLWFFRLAGIRRFLGTEYLRQNSLGTTIPKPTPRVQNESEFLLDLLRSEAISTDTSAGASDLLLTDAEKAAATIWIRAEKGFGKVLVAVAPGSKWESKIWPEERFGEVVGRLIQRFGILPIIFGGAEDRPRGERLIAKWGTGANAAGELTVRQSAALLQKCALYLGNDTGTMHLAATVGTPCVAVFAAIDWVGKWEPFGDGHTVFRRSVECEGCHSPVCTNNHKCLDLIETDEVLRPCERILANNQTMAS